jgi:hypothetical protein
MHRAKGCAEPDGYRQELAKVHGRPQDAIERLAARILKEQSGAPLMARQREGSKRPGGIQLAGELKLTLQPT